MPDPYVRSEFKLSARIGDTLFKDIVAFSSTFGLNSIPTASLIVATGYNVQNGKPATIHDAVNTLTPRAKAKVTLTITTTDGFTTKMPAGQFVVFEGYYAGIGYQRSGTNSSYTLHLIHWLDDLNASSMVNGNWAVGVPHDLAAAACAHSASQSGGSGIMPTPAVDNGEPKVITKDNMEDDLWQKVLKPIFTEIAGFPHPDIQGDDDGTEANKDPERNGNNAAALAALAKMPGDAPKPSALKLDLKGLNSDLIAYSAHAGISRMATDSMAYTSFWGKLVGEFGASFLFAVSPGVTFANVIPFFPGLRQPWLTIEGDEYNSANFNASVAALIESVDIFFSQESGSGYSAGGEGPMPLSFYRPWGRFPAKNTDFRGQILIKEPPAWLSSPVPHEMYAQVSTGVGGPAPGDIGAPGTGAPTPPGGIPRPAAAEKNFKDANILTRFAQHWYQSEVLSQRYGELSGKLRFDIAPGSVIRIMTPNSAIGDEMPMLASVAQVSVMINAEQHIAGTSFTLANLRTEAENRNDILTADAPPLYTESWAGGPLVLGLNVLHE